MDPDKAEKLKRLLHERAKAKDVDLSSPNNRYTLWLENGGQGYLCFLAAPNAEPVYRQMERAMFWGGAILEINGSGDQVTLFTCEVG
jgi:hypothetical protein